MRKILIAIVIGLIITGIPAGLAVRNSYYRDLPNDKWYTNAVEELTDLGLFRGYDDGTFRPGNYINRAEVAVVLQQFIRLVEENSLNTGNAGSGSGSGSSSSANAGSQMSALPPYDSNRSGSSGSTAVSGNQFVLWHASDIHVDDRGDDYRKNLWIETLRDMNGVPWNNAVLAGDLTDDGRVDQLNNLLAAINGYSNHPRSDFYTVAGNHEHYCDDEMPSGERCIDNYVELVNSNLHYTWDKGNIHFIMVSVDCTYQNLCSATLAWLRNEVAANQNKNIVIVNHHPPETWNEYMDILDDYKVDLVLYGHTHASHASTDSTRNYGETLFVNAGSVDNREYRYLVFTDGSNEVIIKSRDHNNHEFQNEYEKRTTLEFAFRD